MLCFPTPVIAASSRRAATLAPSWPVSRPFAATSIKEWIKTDANWGFWTELVEPRSTITSPDDFLPSRLFVEYGMVGFSLLGPWKSNVRAWHNNCKACGREMVAGTNECRYCKRDRERRASADRSRRYRWRSGQVKHRFLETCPVCGKEFRPKRSTALFCSTTCRVKAHRLKK